VRLYKLLGPSRRIPLHPRSSKDEWIDNKTSQWKLVSSSSRPDILSVLCVRGAEQRFVCEAKFFIKTWEYCPVIVPQSDVRTLRKAHTHTHTYIFIYICIYIYIYIYIYMYTYTSMQTKVSFHFPLLHFCGPSQSFVAQAPAKWKKNFTFKCVTSL